MFAALSTFNSVLHARSQKYTALMVQTLNRLIKIIAICGFRVQDALPSKDVGDQISSLLMEQLGGVQYPDDLVTFFSDMSQLMHSHAQALDEDALKGGADISSAMGFYIRHCCVSFHMLAFEVCAINQVTRQHLHVAAWSACDMHDAYQKIEHLCKMVVTLPFHVYRW